MRDDTLPYHGPRHRAAANAAKALAEAADAEKLSNMLRMYADDIENDFGRAHAPQWMREAATRIAKAEAALIMIAAGDIDEGGNVRNRSDARQIALEALAD